MDKEEVGVPHWLQETAAPHAIQTRPIGQSQWTAEKESETFAEAIERELNTSVTVTEGGKQRKITKLDAIAKQQTNKAVQGDHKATALVMKAVEPREIDPKDNLSPVLHEMRAIHAKHEIANQNGTRSNSGFRPGRRSAKRSQRGATMSRINYGPRAERFAMRPPEKDWPINILEGAVRSGKTWCLHPKALYCCAYNVGGRKVIHRRLEAERLQQCS